MWSNRLKIFSSCVTTITAVRRSVATFLKQVHDRPGALGIERGGRLVGQDNARIVGERAGDRDPLRLTAGEFARHCVLAALDAEIGQQLERARLRLRGARARRESARPRHSPRH